MRRELVFAETRKYTNEELVAMSLEYPRKAVWPLSPQSWRPFVPLKKPSRCEWLERGIFTLISDPVYGELVVAQGQYK